MPEPAPESVPANGDSDSPPADAGPASGKGSLGKATGRGFSWLTLSLLIGKACIFLAQVVLGWLLTHEDFGVFAIAASLIGFIKVFHDGGVPQVLVQRGEEDFNRLQGAAFWLGMVVSTTAGLLLAALSPLIARAYEDSRLIPMLLVLAVSLPLGAPASLLRGRLQVSLRFRTISMISAGRFVIRSLGMIVLAMLGFGVMSFVLPLLLVAVFENAATYFATRSRPWFSPRLTREWPGLVRDAYWVVFATICRGLARHGGYLVLGLLLAQDLLGQYYFGFQLTIQITYLVALNLRHVLFPVMTKLADQPERQSRAVLRTTRVLMLVAAPASMIFASIVAPLELLVWGGKWADAVPVMQVFAILSPLMIVSDIVQSALNSRGQFRLAGRLTFLEGCWLMLSSWIAVWLAGDTNIAGIALGLASLQVLYILVVSCLTLKGFDIHPWDFVRGFLTPWGVAAGAVILALLADRFLAGAALPVIRIPVLAGTYFACYLVLAQLLLRTDMNDLASVAPKKIGNIVRKLFLIPSPKASRGG